MNKKLRLNNIRQQTQEFHIYAEQSPLFKLDDMDVTLPKIKVTSKNLQRNDSTFAGYQKIRNKKIKFIETNRTPHNFVVNSSTPKDIPNRPNRRFSLP